MSVIFRANARCRIMVNIYNISSLDLEGPRLPATTSTLELAASGKQVGSLLAVGAEAEVTNSITSGAGTTKQNCVRASGGATGKLVEGDGLTTSLQDPGASSLGEPQSSNRDLLRGLNDAVVVSHSANDNNDLVISTGTLGGTTNLSDRHGRAVRLRQEQLPQYNLVEFRVRTTSKEAIKLHKQAQVRVLRLRSLAVAAALVRLREVIDSHGACAERKSI